MLSFRVQGSKSLYNLSTLEHEDTTLPRKVEILLPIAATSYPYRTVSFRLPCSLLGPWFPYLLTFCKLVPIWQPKTKNYTVPSKYSRNHFISDKYKKYNNLSYISFQIVSLCNHILLSATVKELKSCMEGILWKHFQLFRRILNDVSRISKALSLQCWFQSREQVKISWSQVRRVLGMLQCCHIVLCYEILDQNRPVCWSIVVK